MNCNICDQKLKFILEPHKNKIGISSESKFLEVKLSKLFLCKKCYYFQKKTHQKKKKFLFEILQSFNEKFLPRSNIICW